MSKKAKVVKIQLEVGSKKYDLSLEEAKDLFEALEQFFGKEEVIRYIRDWYPVRPWVRPFYERPCWDRVWMSSTSGTVSGSLYSAKNGSVSLSANIQG